MLRPTSECFSYRYGDGQPRLTLHDLRQTYGSHLVRQGGDVVTVSRQMGHARPSITLDVYSHEFAAVQHQASVAAKLTDAFAGILGFGRVTPVDHFAESDKR